MQKLVYTAAIFKFTGSSLNLSEYFKVRGGNEQKAQRMVTEEEKKHSCSKINIKF